MGTNELKKNLTNEKGRHCLRTIHMAHHEHVRVWDHSVHHARGHHYTWGKEFPPAHGGKHSPRGHMVGEVLVIPPPEVIVPPETTPAPAVAAAIVASIVLSLSLSLTLHLPLPTSLSIPLSMPGSLAVSLSLSWPITVS